MLYVLFILEKRNNRSYVGYFANIDKAPDERVSMAGMSFAIVRSANIGARKGSEAGDDLKPPLWQTMCCTRGEVVGCWAPGWTRFQA